MLDYNKKGNNIIFRRKEWLSLYTGGPQDFEEEIYPSTDLSIYKFKEDDESSYFKPYLDITYNDTHNLEENLEVFEIETLITELNDARSNYPETETKLVLKLIDLGYKCTYIYGKEIIIKNGIFHVVFTRLYNTKTDFFSK